MLLSLLSDTETGQDLRIWPVYFGYGIINLLPKTFMI